MRKSTIFVSVLVFGILLLVFNCSDPKDPVPQNQAPRTPSNPVPSDAAINQPLTVQLEWNCSDPENDAIEYDIYFGTDTDPSGVETDVTDKTYTPDAGAMDYSTQYYWKIVARDSKNKTTTGPVWSFTTTSNDAPTAPTTPSPAHLATGLPLSLQLGWSSTDPEGDPVVHDVWFDTVTPPVTQIATDHADTLLNAPALAFATDYYWKVTAKDDEGNSTEGPVWRFTTVTNEAPTVPSVPSPAHMATGQPLSLQLSWSSSDPEGDPIQYDVWFDTVTPPVTQIATDQADTLIAAPALAFATDYYWKVTAKDDEGNSTEGPIWRFRTAGNQAPAVPSSPSPTHLSTGRELDLSLTWTSSDPEGDPVTYDVYFGTTSPPSTPVATGISNASHSLSNLAFEQDYYWKVVAKDDHSNTTDGPIWRFTTRAGVRTAMTSGTTVDFFDVWGTANNNIYAVGDGGAIYRYNGLQWSYVRSSGGQILNGVYGTSPTNIYAVGRSGADTGLVLRYNGIGWVVEETMGNTELYDVWAASASDVFAAGKWVFQGNGAIWHFNGADWEYQGSADMDNQLLRGVWGTDGSNVYAVSQRSIISGQVLHYNGSAWTVDVEGIPESGGLDDGMYGIFGTAANNIFAVGEGGYVLRYDGSSWSNVGPGPGYLYRDVWGTSESDMFATVLGGGTHHYNGSSWTYQSNPTSEHLYGIWGTSYRNVYAVGANGTILHFE